MSIEIKVNFDRSEAVAVAVAAATAAAVALSAREVQEVAIDRIVGGPKSGRVYTSGPQPLPHQASAAGESPANWTGEMASSIIDQEVDPLTHEVQVTSEHGPVMEFGTVKTDKIKARPFLTPTAEEMKPIHIENVKAAVKEALG